MKPVAGRSKRGQYRSAWLGMFAMLLIFAAPLISLALHSHVATAHSLQSGDPVQQLRSAQHYSVPHHSVQRQGSVQKNRESEVLHATSSHHALMKHASMLMDVCDYCQLFHHTPYVPTVPIDVNKLADFQRQQQYPALIVVADIQSDVSIRPPVRAPPVFSVI